ncbi:uncharacterized protein LOC124451275 [Xenia sp. Carnegie-2017]|uniref:uncharacterized protein LOC124451275 n=1 Tax=Xenia sp. Carnegie-2017 TaxID=2897299 RepID=UPI001F03F94E|nr:uncharacterized protein LOC124451275 [Xenia sp. Carnegie-2017]
MNIYEGLNSFSSYKFVWNKCEFPLIDFVKFYPFPQIVQIKDGFCGSSEETSLSEGDILHLHVLKETQCFLAQTECVKDVQIPLNLSQKVNVCYEKSFKEVRSPKILKNLFPDKYKKVHLQSNLKNYLDNDDVYFAGDTLDVVEFDISKKQLVCLNKENLYVRFSMRQLVHMKVTDITTASFFLAEIYKRFNLPVVVLFGQQAKFKGLVTLQKVITLQTVIASSWHEDGRKILTFPADLEISLVPPSQETIYDLTYRRLLDGVHKRLNVDKIEGTIGPCEICDVSQPCAVKAIPVGAFLLDRPTDKGNKSENDSERIDSFEENNNSFQSRDEQSAYRNFSEEFPSDASGYLCPKDVLEKLENYRQGSDSSSRSHEAMWTNQDRDNRCTDASPHMSTNFLKEKFPDFSEPTENVYESIRRNASIPHYHHVPMTAMNEQEVSNIDVFQAELVNPTERETSCPLSSTIYEQLHPDNVVQDCIDIPDMNETSLTTKQESPDVKRHHTCRSIKDFSNEDVCSLLRELNLEQYEDMFKREQIDGRLLVDMNENMLINDFKMPSFHAMKLRKAVMNNWRPLIFPS